MSAPQTDTPKTDDEYFIANDPGKYVPDFEYVTAAFARTLERELSEAKKERDAFQNIAKKCRVALESGHKWGMNGVKGYSAEIAISLQEEVPKLLSELDALKGNK